MSDPFDPITHLDAAVVDPDLLWRVARSNDLRPTYADDFVVLGEALDRLEPGQPAALVLGPGSLVDSVADLAGVMAQRPELEVVVVSDGAQEPLVSAARATGATVVVENDPDDTTAVVEAGRAAVERARTRHHDQSPAPTPHDADVIVVTAAKGGEGASPVAVNLAAAAAEAGHRVALAETDPLFGDVAMLLSVALPRERDTAPLELDADQVRRRVRHHQPTGIDVFLPPRPENRNDLLPPSTVVTLLDVLAEDHDVIVLDAPFGLVHDADLVAHADHLLLVTRAALTSLKNAAIAVESLGSPSALQAVVWREGHSRHHHDGPATDRESIERAIGAPVATVIPDADEAEIVPADGRPLVLREPKHDPSRALSRLAERVGPRR